MRRDSILKRSNEMQQYAGVYLLQYYSTCFGCLSHPSSGVDQTVIAASGTGHSVRATVPHGRFNLCFLDRSRYFFIQVAPQLTSRG